MTGLSLEGWNLCCKHKKEKEPKMQCSVCGSEETKFVQGISKSGKNIGKPWKAYDCNEPACKNDKGYPNRTFIQIASPRAGNGPKTALPVAVSNPSSIDRLEKKVDMILEILRKNGEINSPLTTAPMEE